MLDKLSAGWRATAGLPRQTSGTNTCRRTPPLYITAHFPGTAFLANIAQYQQPARIVRDNAALTKQTFGSKYLRTNSQCTAGSNTSDQRHNLSQWTYRRMAGARLARDDSLATCQALAPQPPTLEDRSTSAMQTPHSFCGALMRATETTNIQRRALARAG